MKASEIEIGKVYFSSTSHDWQYAGWGVKKVRVKSRDHAFWIFDRPTREYVKQTTSSYRSKKGILVEVLHEVTGGVVTTEVVPLGSIKGLWDVIAPVVASNRKARQDAEKAQSDAHRKSYDDAWKASQRAKELGVLGVTTNGVHCQVTPETLEMLLDLWKATRESAAA